MRILLLDIESAPNVAHVWGLWQQNVATNQLMARGYTLCWAAKWYGESGTFFSSVYNSSEEDMLHSIHRLLDIADVVVHFNGQKFDIPTLNKEFILHGMKPPSPYKQVDLLKVARATFRFPSNKLDYLCQELGLGNKTTHKGHELWVGCMNNDPDCWKVMEEYNVNDVVLLEALYNKFMPWIKTHPNHGLYNDHNRAVCPNCGGVHYQKRGTAVTLGNKYQRYQCSTCGKWFRDSKMLVKRPTTQQERFVTA